MHGRMHNMGVARKRYPRVVRGSSSMFKAVYGTCVHLEMPAIPAIHFCCRGRSNPVKHSCLARLQIWLSMSTVKRTCQALPSSNPIMHCFIAAKHWCQTWLLSTSVKDGWRIFLPGCAAKILVKHPTSLWHAVSHVACTPRTCARCIVECVCLYSNY